MRTTRELSVSAVFRLCRLVVYHLLAFRLPVSRLAVSRLAMSRRTMSLLIFHRFTLFKQIFISLKVLSIAYSSICFFPIAFQPDLCLFTPLENKCKHRLLFQDTLAEWRSRYIVPFYENKINLSQKWKENT